ncbi:alpha/beta hydrolase [Nocardioides gilvus]|uniref:alpha/beta hydrolase n=1 Tax=Nocardioides gilvus TaxID=1735589 RepID=UPI000D7425B0|nr:alpha/beta fold hydrolase [Nocardioides gilvus]
MGRRLWVAAILVGLLAVVTAVAAPLVLDRWRGDATSSADAHLSDQCREVPTSASRVTLTAADGRRLGAASVGDADATTTVVVRHGASQTLCNWLDWAEEVADEQGVRVLLFDRRGEGSSPGDPGLASEPDDLVAAVTLARQEGAEEIVLVASSMGNSVAFSALPALEAEGQPVCAVISISPVLASGPLDARSPAPLPATTWVTWESRNTGIAGTAEQLLADAEHQGVRSRSLPVETDDHSLALVKNHDEVRSFVAEGVGSCA